MMPASKHRRRRRRRYRLNRKTIAGVISSPAAQAVLHNAALLDEHIRELYGDQILTDDEFEQALAQFEAENGIRPPRSPD